MQIFKMVNHFFNHEREVKDVWPNPYILIDLIRCLPFPACFLLLILFQLLQNGSVIFKYIRLLHRSFDIQISGKF